MAKSLLKMEARKLRQQGISLKTISQQINVARSTVSIWIRDIILTEEQLVNLKQRALTGAERGRLKSGTIRKQKRAILIEEYKRLSKDKLSEPLVFTDRELLLMGLMLYWGEGSKKNGELQFCNSDPEMIQFFILWLQKSLKIDKKDIRCWVGINKSHKHRDQVVKEYWSTVTGIPLSQFTGTSLKKVTNKKIYGNFEEHFGTLFIRVTKAMKYYYMVLGMLEVLKNTRQGSSVG